MYFPRKSIFMYDPWRVCYWIEPKKAISGRLLKTFPTTFKNYEEACKMAKKLNDWSNDQAHLARLEQEQKNKF